MADSFSAVFFLLHFPYPSFAIRRDGKLRTVGVTHHRVLWSPDFPLSANADSDRPADLWTFAIIADRARETMQRLTEPRP
jgi:hypothetical protein